MKRMLLYVFIEQGVAMFTTVLRTMEIEKINIKTINE